MFAVLIDEFEHDLQEAKLEVAETKAAIFNSTRPKHRMFIEWNEYNSEKCGNDTMIPNADSSTGYRCTLKDCENEESDEIEVDCDICEATGKRQEPPETGAGEKKCNGCNGTGKQDDWAKSYPFSEDNVREFANFCANSGGFTIC